MPTHSPAPADAVTLVAERVASDYYPDLVEAQVTINTLFAYTDDAEKPAVKLGGYPCSATIKVNSEKDRIEGKADATMTIDGRAWNEEWSDAEKVALIDHELQHLVVARSRPTKQSPVAYILSDDAGRPRLKIRKHDYQIGYFAEIARRHGEAAPEVKAVRVFMLENEQQLFPFAGNDREYGHAGSGAGPRLAAV